MTEKLHVHVAAMSIEYNFQDYIKLFFLIIDKFSRISISSIIQTWL